VDLHEVIERTVDTLHFLWKRAGTDIFAVIVWCSAEQVRSEPEIGSAAANRLESGTLSSYKNDAAHRTETRSITCPHRPTEKDT
jgi:hypothetical protein